MTVRCALAMAPLLAASAAQAHPGHGLEGGSGSLAHFLTSPLHVGFAAAVLLGLGGLLALRSGVGVRRRR